MLVTFNEKGLVVANGAAHFMDCFANMAKGCASGMLVTFNDKGLAVANGATHFMDRVADMVKGCVFFTYESWTAKKKSPQSVDCMESNSGEKLYDFC